MFGQSFARASRFDVRTAVTALAVVALVFLSMGPAGPAPVSADPSSPLALTKTASANPVASGALLTYTIRMENLGGSKLDNVVMTDQVNGVGTVQAPPALPQLTITSTKGTCTQGGPNGNVVTCNAGTMAGREVWTVTIGGQVTASSNTVLDNTASVTGTRSAQTFNTNGSVSVSVQGGTGGGSPLPDLTLNKTGPTSVATSTNMTYTLTVNNVGTANASDIRLIDTLPDGVAFVSAETTSLFTCSPEDPLTPPITVTCTGGAVNQGQNATIKINATSPATTGQITNTAMVDPDDTIEESNELNNASAAVNTNVTQNPPPAPLLTIIKTDNKPDVYPWSSGAGPDPVNPGQQITYKIQVKNNATSRADDVIVSDGTQGLEAASIIANQVVAGGSVGTFGGCVVNAPQVRCSIRSLNAGGTLTITIQGTVISTAGANIFNTATVNGNIKNIGVTATDSESTTVRPQVDLTITMADSPDPACARTWPTSSDDLPLTAAPNQDDEAVGDPTGLLAGPVCLGGLTYRFVVGNSGNGPATGVVVRDPLPAGVILDSYDVEADSGFTCATSGQVVTCGGGTIPAASTKWIEFRLVAPPGVGSITNTVTVDPDNAIFESDETNQTATATTTISTGVDLVVWKGDSKDLDPPGDGAPDLLPGTGTALNDGYDPIATRGTQTYTIYVDNVGTQDVPGGIRVRDTLPVDTIFLSVVPDATHGFTCSHDGSATGGVVECVGGELLGTMSEFYRAPGQAGAGPGDDFATIKIRVFARRTVGTMRNEVRVDPLNEIAEVREQNNLDIEDTVVSVGDADKGAYQQLTVDKTQVTPAGPAAQNGIVVYDLAVTNDATDPVSNVVLKDTLPSGTRFIEAKDTSPGVHAFFCAHDGAATGGVVTCTGGDLDGSIETAGVGTQTRRVTIKVFAPNTPGTYTNIATVDPDNLVAEGNEFDNDDQQNTVVSPCADQASCTAGNAVYELKITKSQVSPANDVARNAVVTYDVLVENLGSDPVSGIVVRDTLPEGSVFISAKDTAPPTDPLAFTCGAPNTDGVVQCVGGTLSGTNAGLAIPGAGQSRTIRFRVFAPDIPGTYQNLAQVDPNNAVPEGNEFNNSSAVETVVKNGGNGPYIDLTVDKTQILPDPTTDGGKVAPGAQLVYQLQVANQATGPDAGTAFNVSVRDVLPAHVTFFNAYDLAVGPGQFTCAYANGVVNCTGGTLAPGESREIYVLVLAPSSIDQFATNQSNIQVTVGNQALVDPDNAILEGDEINNADTVSTLVRSKINLTLEKEGPNTAQQNQEADYVVTVENVADYGGGAIAYDTRVVDSLPVGLIPLYVQAEPSNMACQVFENPTNYIDCVGDLEPGQPVTITVHVFITAESGPMDNEACVDPDNLIQETNELDNCKTKTTLVAPPAAPNLNINKNASTGTVTPGEEFSYTITVANVGNADAQTGIQVTDTLPTEVTFKSVTATNGFACSEAGGTVTCDDPGSGLAAGQSTLITIEVTVDSGVTGSFTNTATVNEGPGESDSVTTNVGATGIDLILADISDSPDPANVGQNVTYTFAVSNAGTGPSGAFDITAKMDSGALNGLKFIGAAASQGFICGAIVTDTVTCTGSLLSGQSTNVSITFQVLAGTPTSHTLSVSVDPTNTIVESSEANNDDTELTTVTGSLCTSCVDLVAGGILDTPDPVAPGGSITRIATMSNAGDTSTAVLGADSAVIWVMLDGAAETLGTYSATSGFSCTDSIIFGLIVVECVGDLGPGQGVALTVNSTASGASDGATLFSYLFADPADLFPEGSGAGQEFTNANNQVTESTSVVAP